MVHPTAAPKLLEQLRDRLRYKRMSLRTEEAYLGWARRFIHFHGKRHPATLAEQEVVAFLQDPASTHLVAASTHNQALNALAFLYTEVLERPLGELRGLERVKRPARVPIVLNRQEVSGLLAHPHRAGTARAQGRKHDHDLYPRPQPARRAARPQPVGLRGAVLGLCNPLSWNELRFE